ncbi:MAG: hypothetical protein ABI167_11600 [Nitrosospira sp.]
MRCFYKPVILIVQRHSWLSTTTFSVINRNEQGYMMDGATKGYFIGFKASPALHIRLKADS